MRARPRAACVAALLAAVAGLGGCPHEPGFPGDRPDAPAADAAADAPRGDELGTWVEDWRDEIIYQLLTDRFANGDPGNDLEVDPDHPARYHGGDWQGVIDRLDYLEALGVTAIWISPVVANTGNGYHGYWTQAFDEPNPHFGDLATLRALVDAAHARGIKVIVDVVVNHVGHVFFYDRDENGVEGDGEFVPAWDPAGVRTLDGARAAPIVFFDDPARRRHPPRPAAFADPSWYHGRGRIGNWDDAEQRVLGDFGGSKDLRTSHPDVRAALIAILADWITWTDVDGLRIDTVRHVEPSFLRELAEALRAHAAARGKRNLFLFGEALTGDRAELARYSAEGGLDAVLDFALYFSGVRDVLQGGAPTRRLEELWADKEQRQPAEPHPGGIGVPPRRALVTFLDNHDVRRFLHDTPSPAALRAALTYLLTYDGIPCVYYGTEHEYAGGPDPANREDLWPTGYATDGETFRHLARLIALRKAHEALRRGELRFRWTTTRTGAEQDAGIVAFERFTAGDRVLVVVNTHATAAKETSAASLGFGTMAVGFAPGTRLVDRLDPAAPPWTVPADQRLVVRVPPRSGRILVPE